MSLAEESQTQNQKDLDRQLDKLEEDLALVRIQYEQYFTGLVTRPPEKEHAQIVRTIKLLLRAPFKNSARRFRLRTLVTRYHTYNTYWERVNKQREDGTYCKDIFKADLRERQQKELEELASTVGASQRGLHQLYNAYEEALRKNGGIPDQLNFGRFKDSMLKTAQEIRQKHGAAKIHYKVAIKDGKVILKASAKSASE